MNIIRTMKLSQTEITSQVNKIVASFKSSGGLDRIFEALAWLHKNCKLNPDLEYKNKYFRARTAEEIITSRQCTGCTDFTLVFLVLIKASGFSARYVEAIETKWLEEGGENIGGHVFVEVKINNRWYIVDPQGALIRVWYGKRYHIYARGEDSWDLDIKNLSDLQEKFLAYREKYLRAEKG